MSQGSFHSGLCHAQLWCPLASQLLVTHPWSLMSGSLLHPQHQIQDMTRKMDSTNTWPLNETTTLQARAPSFMHHTLFLEGPGVFHPAGSIGKCLSLTQGLQHLHVKAAEWQQSMGTLAFLHPTLLFSFPVRSCQSKTDSFYSQDPEVASCPPGDAQVTACSRATLSEWARDLEAQAVEGDP